MRKESLWLADEVGWAGDQAGMGEAGNFSRPDFHDLLGSL